MNYGQEIKRLREKGKWTQQELADAIGMERYNLSRIETGARSCSEAYFTKIINILGYDLKKKIVKNSVKA